MIFWDLGGGSRKPPLVSPDFDTKGGFLALSPLILEEKQRQPLVIGNDHPAAGGHVNVGMEANGTVEFQAIKQHITNRSVGSLVLATTTYFRN